jgi:hypothetical protein
LALLVCVAEGEPKDFGMEGWLCPAVSEHVAAAPKTIDIQVEPKELIDECR